MGSYASYDPVPISKLGTLDQDFIDEITTAIPRVNADWNASSGNAQILNKPLIPVFSGLAKISVGPSPPANPGTGDIWIETS